MIKSNLKNEKGFTLVELMVTVGIFAMMTALLLAKYGTFNQSILLTNLAYDVALTIRNAQSYGLNVKSAPEGERYFSNQFNYPFGVHFDSSKPKEFLFFVDGDSDSSNSIYDNSGVDVTRTTVKGGSEIFSICAGVDDAGCVTASKLDITFKRPDPNAIITVNSIASSYYSYAKITLKATDGSTKKVIIRSTGQISVE